MHCEQVISLLLCKVRQWGVIIPLLLCPFSLQAQWERVLPGHGANSLDTAFGFVFADDGFERIYRSTDNGKNWSLAGSGGQDEVYDYTQINNLLFSAAGINGIYISRDSGRTWGLSLQGSAFQKDFTVIESIGFCLITNSAKGFYRSTDTGHTWDNDTIGIIAPVSWGNPPIWPAIFSLKVIAGKVFAGTNYGIYCSSDSGYSWSVVDSSLYKKKIVIRDLSTCGNFAFAASDQGVLRSSDSGSTWSLPDTQLIQGRSLSNWNNVLFCGGFQGLWKSLDFGTTWTKIIVDTSLRHVYPIITSGDYLIVCGDGNTTWRANLSTLSIANSRSGKLSLESSYPNPFNSSTKIVFSLLERSVVTLSITDATGRETQILSSQIMEGGSHEVRWDASQFSSGMYMCRLVSSSGVEMAKVVVQH